MFEGLVRQLVLGYLGRYVKDIQKEQLKITLWNEEVLLENIELILEAFDYLQLPFALKQGRVGRLSIKIPWKKLGWDPIIIVLEDVFICASQRDDQEWCFDAVERREFAGKKAKLAAAELAKLSRRVCDNQAGQSFISYITAKILDSIQVSIRNFHVLYRDVQTDLAQIILGLRFSSLTIMKQTPVGSASGRVRGGQVAKIVEIIGLEIYCSASVDMDSIEVDNIEYSESRINARFEGCRYDHILAPFDVSMSLLVDRSGKLDNDAPQYSVSAELTGLVLSLNEVQLQQILILWDYLCTCQLREKYGRYRPSCSSLLRKPKGWQKLWWQYAQKSILSDVRKKLKKTSWNYLGQRLSYRRKYVNLYKTKLDFLRQEQSIDEFILRELEQMEKESDIDDILSYRSAAERELQEFLSKSSTSNVGVNGSNISGEKSRNDERSSGRSGGWLNWLSLGMLGAGGTDDSSEFSGVVSDEVVKDIYEATKFHPMVLSNGDAAANDKIYTCAIKFSVHQIHATLRSMKSGQEIAELILDGATIECKLWEEFATIIAFIDSGEMVHSCNQNILLMRKSFMEKSVLEDEQPSLRVQVDVSPNQEVELSVKVMLQPLEVTCDVEFFRNFVEFFNVLKSFKFQHERVLLSLKGIEDIKARLLSKAEYILSSRKKVIWDVSIINVIINVPWKNANLGQCNMVLESGALLFVSKCDLDCPPSCIEDQSFSLNHFLNSISTCNFSMGFQLQDLYDHYEVKLNDFEVKIMMPYSQTISILEKFGVSIVLASCVIPDESILKQLEVYIIVSSLHAHLSPTIYGSILELIAHLDILYSRSEPVILENLNPPNITSNRLGNSSFGFSMTVNLESITFDVDLANDGENSSALILTLRDLDIRYALKEFEECWICTRALQIVTYPLRNERDNHILCSSGNVFAANSALQHGAGVELSDQSGNFNDRTTSAEACFRLHYEGRKSVDVVSHKCTVFLNDADLHCYPYIFGLLIGFYDRISTYGTSRAGENSFSPTLNAKRQKMNPGFGFRRFGFSNFFESGSSEYASTSLDCFPFVTIHNSCSLGSLESSLVYPISEWRKYFNLRDRKIRSPKCNVKKGSSNFHAPPLEPTSGLDAFPVSGMFGDANLFVIDLNLFGIRVHFHDSSCILGTVTLTTSKSSLFVYENFMDILCSTEGLTLSSSWWTQNVSKFLWGSSLPNLSPILNIRVRKGDAGSLCSRLEVSIGIQHVCCILPPEYLAIIIGYFSLPDWSSNSSVLPVTENHEFIGVGNESTVVYKFEILDSTLIFPVENDDHQFLKLGIPELYCSFIHKSDLSNVLKDIPPEYLVPEHKVAKRNHCLNVFGRDLILSFLLFKDDGFGCFMFDQDARCVNITLIAPLSADVWVRIPCDSAFCSGSSSASTCVMARIGNCQLIADDRYCFDGFEVLLNVINQFSSVEDESKGFTDVLQFLQLKKTLKENGRVSAIASGVILTEVRCCVDSLLIKLNRLRKDSNLLEQVAKADMQFICSASLRNETSLSLDFSFSSLAIYSLLNSVMLARCSVTCSNSPVLNICLLKSDQGENDLQISLPVLDIWLHVLDWSEVIDLFNSYAGKLTNSTLMGASSKNSTNDIADPIGNKAVAVSQGFLQNSSTSDYFVPKTKKEDTVALIVRSENVGITVHFPFWVDEEASSEVGVAEVQVEKSQNVSSNIIEGKRCKFIAVTTHSKSSELTIVGKSAKLKFNLEKTSGTMRICENKTMRICEEKSDSSWPFFQMFQINVETEICNNQMDLVHVNVEVQCDRLDVWLSHQVFFFWHDVGFTLPEAGSSQFAISGLDLKIQLRKVSLLLTDGRWSCSGPLFEILARNFVLDANVTDNSMESSVTSDLQVNYNNIDKVLWEPFVEPWKFQINMIRKHEMTALIDGSITTDIHFSSIAQLNLNFTESLIECVFRTTEMIRDAWGLKGPTDLPENQRFLNPCFTEYSCAGRYAPYILQNLTSLPLVYHVDQGLVNSHEFDISEIKDGKSVQPSSSVPIYINETPEEQLFRYRATHSSDRLSEKHSNGVAHHFMTIQLDGTSVPSAPISMDFVGLTYFEVDFSKASSKKEVEKTGDASKHHRNIEGNSRTNANDGFVFPVVFDVSVQRYSKLIRLYSTVILLNATAVPLELRFDIPFGVSPKILDPINPGQEFPLPLHLAEAGRMRWRPLGNSYLWSEAHDLSNILSQESKIGFLRSFVCYPSHPNSDPFRCCVSVRNISLPSSSRPKKGSSLHISDTLKQSVDGCSHLLHDLDKSKKRFIHQVALSSPLIVNNYLPEAVSLTIESGGATRTALLSEVETSFHHIDPSHDLGLEFYMHGFKSSVLKFPRTETFSTMAKFSGTKFFLSETIAFDPVFCNGPIYVTVEKTMDTFSGARELCIFVPFLLYNCTGFPLIISDSANDMKRTGCVIPSCYDLVELELRQGKKDGLSLLSSNHDSYSAVPHIESPESYFSKNHIISTRNNVNSHLGKFQSKLLISSVSSKICQEQSDRHDLEGQKASLNGLKSRKSSSSQFTLWDSDFVDNERGKVKACMYSPNPISSSSEIMVRVGRFLPECVTENMPNSSWSGPFSLVPPSGSINVLVPQSSSNAAFIMSVTASALPGPFAERTQAITFQPRYVISNACSKELCYKQKGTEFVFHLGTGEHSHLHWTDTTRELLVSIRFNEPGWQWSGSFLPDHLGDTQVKMRNYVSGALNMIRVEVQNADVSIRDEKVVGSHHGNSGTNLILLSDDDTGYMPYRIDNFSKERLRVYQQRCETFETIVHPYTSCPYAWDEPCYLHRLTIEVPGERVVGSYALDDVKEYVPVYLPSTSEKPERKLLLSVHAVGATKVLTVIDSRYHDLKDMKDSSVPWFREKRKDEQKHKFVDYKEKISLMIPYIGISLINSYPQELLYACATNITIDMLQSLDQQKLSFQISSLQIDNQLPTTPYPVILSFDHEYRSNLAGRIRTKEIKSERILQITPDSFCEPVLYLAVARWRKKDISLVSFEYISVRVADFRLELEQEVILSLFDFFRTVSSRFQSRILPFSDPTLHPLIYDVGFIKESTTHVQPCMYMKARDDQLHSMNVLTFYKYHKSRPPLPSIVPIGAPWQKIYLLARRQKKIYVELFDLAPINLSLSFSSAPWMHRNGVLTSGESLIHRGLMALADVEGAQIHLKQLTITHQMASWESIQEILIRHYIRQLLHEMYKVFGSAGVIGNPLGFARSMGLGIRDFLSVPARSILQSPTGLITGVAQGTTSLVSNTVYAISDATTQFSKAAHKGIVAFAFDDQAVARMEKQQKGVASHSEGVINEVLEGLTGLLQSPIKGAEKHGLPGLLSGIAIGITGLVARPAASILEVTGRTAQSIRSRSRLYQMGPQRYRVRLPRPLSREFPLQPYSWEEAVGQSVLLVEGDEGLKLKNETLVMCKALKQAGKFIVITERVILIVSSNCLVDFGNPEFRGVAVNLEWVIESEISLESVIHADTDEGVVHIVGSSSDALLKQSQHQLKKGGGTRTKRWSNFPTALPLFQTNLELESEEDAGDLLRILLSTIEQGKERGWGSGYLLHQSNIKQVRNGGASLLLL